MLSLLKNKVIGLLELPLLLHLFFEPRTVVDGAEDKNHGVLHVVNDLDALKILNILRPAVRQIHEPVLGGGLWRTCILFIVRTLRLNKRVVVFAVPVRHYLREILLQVDFFEHQFVQLERVEKDVQAPLINAIHDEYLLLSLRALGTLHVAFVVQVFWIGALFAAPFLGRLIANQNHLLHANLRLLVPVEDEVLYLAAPLFKVAHRTYLAQLFLDVFSLSCIFINLLLGRLRIAPRHSSLVVGLRDGEASLLQELLIVPLIFQS